MMRRRKLWVICHHIRDLDDSMSWLISHSMTLFSEDITEEEVLLLQKWSEAIVDPTKKEEATSEIKNFNDRITQARKDAVGLHSR